MNELIIRTRSDSEALMRDAAALEDEVWEPFGFLSYTDAHRKYYDGIIRDFSDHQLCMVDEATGKPVALVNCVPFSFADELDELPQGGWDWLVETGSRSTGKATNILGALAVSVPVDHRGKGYARRMIQELKSFAIRHQYDAVVVPVRPSTKCNHPFVPMTTYMHWQNQQGECFDPWLRSHLSEGAKIIRSCERSMVVREHVAFWETWAGQRFERSGRYVFDGGLVPVDIDLAQGVGIYREPNVWVGYSL